MPTEIANMGMGPANPYLGKQNPYLQANIDAASGDMVKNFDLATRPALNAAMVKSGSFGNSALGELDNEAQSTLQKNLGNLSNSARMQDYTQQQSMYQWDRGLGEQQRQFDLGYGRSLFNDAYGQSRNDLSIGMGLVGGLAGANAADVANSTTQQNTPLNYWNQFQGAANSIGQGFGSQTQGTTSNPAVSALGGAQLGQQAWKAWNSQPSTTGETGITSQPLSFGSGGSSGGGWWGAT